MSSPDKYRLPAKKIRKPSKRWSTVSNDEYSSSPETKEVKTKISKKLVNSHVGIIDETKTEPTLPTLEETHGMNESMNGACKATSSVTSVTKSPASITNINSEDSSATSEEKLVTETFNSEGSNLVSGLKAKAKSGVKVRTKNSSDSANLEIQPPRKSGYGVDKLHLNIDKVNDTNIEQLLSDPEGIIFKLNDPVPEGWEKEAQLKLNEKYPKWSISYISPTGRRFTRLKKIKQSFPEASFDFTPFDFRPLNPKLQEIANVASGGRYSYRRRKNMPPSPFLSILEKPPGIGAAVVVPKPSRRQSAQNVHQQTPVLPVLPPQSKIMSGFGDAENNDVTAERGEDGRWVCPAQGCDKYFRKYFRLKIHFNYYHPEMKVKPAGVVKVANVVEKEQAGTAFCYVEPSLNASKVLPSPCESDISSIPSPSIASTTVAVETTTSKILRKKSRKTNLRIKEGKEEPAEKIDMSSGATIECKFEIPENKECENDDSTSSGTSLKGRIKAVPKNPVQKPIRKSEKRKVTSTEGKRVENLVKNPKGCGKTCVKKHVRYFSDLTKKQARRVRREIVEKNIPIRFLGEPKKSKREKHSIINCTCNSVEEIGMMVQCDLCYSWQHGDCIGFHENKDVPKYYVCESCRNPGNPSVTRNWEWQMEGYLQTGQLPTFSNTAVTNVDNARVRTQCIKLRNHIQSAVACIENCNFKLQIAQKKPEHPKLYNWEYPAENPVREKQILDFRKTYKPLFYRFLKARKVNDVDLKSRMQKSFLKHLYWRKFQVLVEDLKLRIGNLDTKFLMILNKLYVYQRSSVRKKMKEKRLLNLEDLETSYTNPFAIWARKGRQRQNWESKMKRHASILEKEISIQEMAFKLATVRPSLSSQIDRPVGDNTNEFSQSSVLNPPGRLSSVGSSNILDNVIPTEEIEFSFCKKCSASALKTWDWSDLTSNRDELFEKNNPDRDSAWKKNSPKTYTPGTLKSLCETVIASLNSNKESSLSGSDRDAKRENLLDNCNINVTDNIETEKEREKPIVEDFDCSDTESTSDFEECPADKEIPFNLDEECIRCYLISVSLSEDPNQSEWKKFSAVNHRDISAFLSLPDAYRQGIWDSVENTLPNIPVGRRRNPIVNRKERKSTQRIIRYYYAELRGYWKRMFNIRLRCLDLIMQQQTWADELVRLYCEIHVLLEDMRKAVDDSSEIDKLGEVLLRKIDIIRSICGTPDSSRSYNLITSANLSYENDDSQVFSSGEVLQATDKPCSSKQFSSQSSETMFRRTNKSPEKTEKRSYLWYADDSAVDVVESYGLKTHSGEIPNIYTHYKNDQQLETEKPSSSKSYFKNLQYQKHSTKMDGKVETITRDKDEEKDELLNPNQNLNFNDHSYLNTAAGPNTDINLLPVNAGPSWSNIEAETVLPSVLSDDLVIDSSVLNISEPFLKKLRAETSVENLLDHILSQEELIDSHLDRLERKVCELERDAKIKDPESNKTWIQTVKLIVAYNNKLQLLKDNVEILCGGQDANSTTVSDDDNDINVEESSSENSIAVSDDDNDINVEESSGENSIAVSDDDNDINVEESSVENSTTVSDDDNDISVEEFSVENSTMSDYSSDVDPDGF